jgi:hypothetical protein
MTSKDHQDTVANTGAAVRFQDQRSKEAAHPYTALLLLCRATLYTSNDEMFYLQRFPINAQVYKAIIQRIREINSKIEINSDTHDNTKLLLQSCILPNIKAEATLHSDSVCLVLQNVKIEMVAPLVPFLLIPRLTSKV